MIKYYQAPIVELEFPNGWRPLGSKTVLYRVNYSKHTIVDRNDENTVCVVRVDADEAEHAAIAADADIVETTWLQ